MKTLNQFYNPLLERKEIEVSMEHAKSKTPSGIEIKKIISEHFKSPEDLVVVRYIKTEFGDNVSKINAYIYENKDVFTAIEIFRKKKIKDKKTDSKEEDKK
ncbi:hypothetical protein J4214_04770 [Candidatus Woesearchaeota archaeon]|nr:hypothetical protein [Candidatus Woesearchaeota archaeon]